MIDAGYMDMLLDPGQLVEFWANFGKDFPSHPAALDGSFTNVPITLYGTSLTAVNILGTKSGSQN